MCYAQTTPTHLVHSMSEGHDVELKEHLTHEVQKVARRTERLDVLFVEAAEHDGALGKLFDVETGLAVRPNVEGFVELHQTGRHHLPQDYLCRVLDG